MNHSNDLTRAREQLVEQLVLLGDEKKRFLDAYFAMPGKERMGELIPVDTPSGALRVLIAAITFTTDNPSRKGGVANGA